jgi:hypothetical protein
MRAEAMLRPREVATGRFVILLLCCLLPQMCQAQTERTKGEQVRPQKLIVKVLDGYTGLPMWFEFPDVWIGSAGDAVSRLSIQGKVQFDVGEAKPTVIRLSPNWYADCRFEGDVPSGGSAIEYSIGEIMAHGIVADNVCGSRHAKPTPGVIVLYLRHRTLKEIIAL